MSLIGKRIRERRKALKLTQAGLGERVGVAASAVSQWETGESEPRRDNIAKLAEALQLSEEWIEFGRTPSTVGGRAAEGRMKRSNLYEVLPEKLSGELDDASVPVALPARGSMPVMTTKRVRVVGEVQAGVTKPAIEWEPDEQFDVEVPLKAAFSKLPTFALRVAGPSMDEVFPEGSFVICVRLLDLGPLFKIESGSFVVVLKREATGDLEATVKEIEIEADGSAWLWPRSSNPHFQAPIHVQDIARHEDDEIAVWGLVIADVTMRI